MKIEKVDNAICGQKRNRICKLMDYEMGNVQIAILGRIKRWANYREVLGIGA